MKVTFANVEPLVRETLQQGGRVRLTVTGMSMRPFILPGDAIELASATPETLAVGVVVLVETCEGQYLLHRIARKTADGVFTRGDANPHEEGPFNTGRVLAYVTGVVRGDRVAPLNTGARGLLARLWHATLADSWLIGGYDCSRRLAGRVLRHLGLRPPLPPPP